LSSDKAPLTAGVETPVDGVVPGKATDANRPDRGLKRLLREPLLHFLVVGLALFAVYQLLQPDRMLREESNRIEINADDLRQLEIAWFAQWGRAPTRDELHGLVDTKIREEILYREALTLGLDKDDTIIKRRLAQKMEFLADDASSLPDPSRETLKAWYVSNPDRFRQAGLISFRHIFFSVDDHREHARSDAARSLEKLAAGPADLPSGMKIGDPFMFQDNYSDRSREEIANVFGTQFADSVFQLKPGGWRGPVESGLGWHLVFVRAVTPGRVPAFEEIEPEVKSEWIAQQRAQSRRRAFDVMKARYAITVADVPNEQAAFGEASESRATP
jgi:peptidyl-prolyl cis-trans isomerase C